MKALLITTIAATLLTCNGCRSHKESAVREDKRLDRYETKHLDDSLAIESQYSLTGAIEIDSPVMIIARWPDDKSEIKLITVSGRQMRATVSSGRTASVTEVIESRDSLATSAQAVMSSEVSRHDNTLPYLIIVAGATLLLAFTALSWRGKHLRL